MLRQRNEGNVLGVVLLNIFDGFVDKRILYLRYARLRVGLETVDGGGEIAAFNLNGGVLPVYLRGDLQRRFALEAIGKLLINK